MSQNISTAVMQRRVEAHDSLDDFPTPPWATRALCEQFVGRNQYKDLGSVWEPCCNRGYMARPLGEYFSQVYATDIHDYGWSGQGAIEDFLWPSTVPPYPVNWIVANPPFRLAEQFIERASQVATDGFAMIVRTAFLEGVGRHGRLFTKNPPSIIAQFSERVVMHKGKVTATGSTATAYCWLVWVDGEEETQFRWIRPCRKELERPGDYEEAV